MGMTSTATRLIARFGQTATLTKLGPPAGPPWAPMPGVPVNHTVTVAVTNYTIEELAGLSIAGDDLRVFMTAGVAPNTSDTLTIGGIVYGIHRVGVLGPDGVVICYELQVRR
jgi:hypothetical protein